MGNKASADCLAGMSRMSRLHYLDVGEIHSLVEALTHDQFPGTPAFHLAGAEGLARLESALAQPRWPHHRIAQQKAAALHYSLNKNHPFVDGNKRLAVTAMGWFLFRNGFVLFTTNDHLVDFALRVADDRLSRDASAIWIARRALRTTWSDLRIQKWSAALSGDEFAEIQGALEAASSSASDDRATRFMASVANLLHQGRVR